MTAPKVAIANLEAAIAEWGQLPSLVEAVENYRRGIVPPPVEAHIPPPVPPRRRWRYRRKEQQRHLGRRDSAALRDAIRLAGIRPDTCEACGADYLPCELDRRIPGDWDGEYAARNVHYLCLVCHRAKTKLERAITAGYATAMHVERWLELAYPEPLFDALLYYEHWRAARCAEVLS